MTADALLRAAGPAALALLAAWAFDRMTARRGFDPPGFAEPWRRAVAFAAIACVLWAGVFSPLGSLGKAPRLDPAKIGVWNLFLLHELMIGAILVWFFAGFAGLRRSAERRPSAALATMETAARRADVPPDLTPHPPLAETGEAAIPDPAGPITHPATAVPPPAAPAAPAPRVTLGRQLLAQLGLAAPSPAREAGLGLVLGIGAWMAVIVSVALVAVFLIYGLGMKDALPKQPPSVIPWLAGLPFALRLLLALSAGIVEEAFFRGLLQPRMGIALSTAMFILAHTAYGQPFLLIGVGILSVIYAFLVRWRQNIWPSMAAHALFDGVQLLVIIPAALKMMGGHLPAVLAALF